MGRPPFPPSFGQCPKENVFFSLRPSLSWPSFSKVLPLDLARAGFYYEKKKGALDKAGFFYEGALDSVICPFCHKWVEGWADDDVPSKEHAKESPACPFVTGRNLGIKDVGIRAWRRK